MIRFSAVALLLASVATSAASAADDGRRWLAGDHHVHSEFSVKWRADPAQPDAPPEPVLGGDARYPISHNATMARRHGLDWMVSTDHGGPLHSRVNAEMAYPALLKARAENSDLVLFYGMEFDTPGGEHSSLIIPATPEEREQLRAIEAGFSERDEFPTDPARDTKPRMIEALRFMAAQPVPPVIIVNHPSRTAPGLGKWGLHAPSEFAAWQDAAPGVAVGMEGAPGHQAARVTEQRTSGQGVYRGIYEKFPTLGGFDQMTARLGGAWDALLGQGRRWWITATSDSHVNWRDGGVDFWPGEYSKTWVLARKDPADILDGLRKGRVFVTTGDLITALDVTAIDVGGHESSGAGIGGTLPVPRGGDVDITIRFTAAQIPNANGDTPQVDHVDLIVGEIISAPKATVAEANPTTRVARRFTAADWATENGQTVMRHRLENITGPIYLRVRGSNTAQGEPEVDTVGEDPWADLWFYANPIFIELR